MPKIQVDKSTLYYEALGPAEGELILLMHGFTETGRALLVVANELTGAGYRVLLPDMPGYGRSTPPSRSFPERFYDRDAELMGQFLAAVGIERAHIMGFSDGGETALLTAIRFPERCRSVTALGAIGSIPPEVSDYARRVMPGMAIQPSWRKLHPGQTVEQWPAQWLAGFLSYGDDVSLSRAGEIRCPALLMVGEHDGLNPLSAAQRYLDAIPGSHKQIGYFPGAGHAIHDDQPGPFMATVLSFLSGISA